MCDLHRALRDAYRTPTVDNMDELAEVTAEMRTLGAQRKGARTLLKRTEARMKTLIRRADELGMLDVEVGELVDYSRSQRLLIRQGRNRHPGGPAARADVAAR
jgi:hypothetical protein